MKEINTDNDKIFQFHFQAMSKGKQKQKAIGSSFEFLQSKIIISSTF